MKKWVIVGFILTVLWVFIRGATFGKFINEALIGIGIGFTIAYALRTMYPGDIDLKHWISVAPIMLYFIWIFAKELVSANLAVAKKIILPSDPIEPDVIEVELRIENPAAISILANSISLTPGTLVIDYDEERNSLYVHSITGKNDREEFIRTVQNWENLLLKIFTNQRMNTTRK